MKRIIYFFLIVSDLELRTSGLAGENQGDKMGVYQFHSEDESQGRVYKQRHDNGGTQQYLYRSVSRIQMYTKHSCKCITKLAIQE